MAQTPKARRKRGRQRQIAKCRSSNAEADADQMNRHHNESLSRRESNRRESQKHEAQRESPPPSKMALLLQAAHCGTVTPPKLLFIECRHQHSRRLRMPNTTCILSRKIASASTVPPSRNDKKDLLLQATHCGTVTLNAEKRS